jgi:hypothetical protein
LGVAFYRCANQHDQPRTICEGSVFGVSHTGEGAMILSRVAALALGSAMLARGAAAESIKVAPWTMNNLHHVLGEPLRDRAPARTDYKLLRNGLRSGTRRTATSGFQSTNSFNFHHRGSRSTVRNEAIVGDRNRAQEPVARDRIILGGPTYRPTMSSSLGANSGSVDRLKVLMRCGWRSCATQMRCTERKEMPKCLAIARPVQWVAVPGPAR